MAPEAGGAPDAVYIGSSPGEDPLAPDVKIQSRRSGATNRWTVSSSSDSVRLPQLQPSTRDEHQDVPRGRVTVMAGRRLPTVLRQGEVTSVISIMRVNRGTRSA